MNSTRLTAYGLIVALAFLLLACSVRKKKQKKRPVAVKSDAEDRRATSGYGLYKERCTAGTGICDPKRRNGDRDVL